VPEMNVSFRFNAALRNGDEIRLMAPPGAGATCFFFNVFFSYEPLKLFDVSQGQQVYSNLAVI